MYKGKDANYDTLINSWKWQKVRSQYMASVGWLCEMCKKEGRDVAAEECHHIIPLESIANKGERKAMAYNTTNLMALCKQHHHQIHDELESHTKAEKEKRTTQEVLEFVERFTK